MKKILSILTVFALLFQMLTLTSSAEDIHQFPPKRAEIGTMKVYSSWYDCVLGLRTDGTVNYQNFNTLEHIMESHFRAQQKTNPKAEAKAYLDTIKAEKNIVDIACTNSGMAALKANGTVLFLGSTDYDLSSWTDVVAIDAGTSHFVGLKADGTVLVVGDNSKGQCNTMGWGNVSKIRAYNNSTFGIRKDGTVLATGDVKNYSKLSKLENVKDVFCEGNGALLNNGEVEYFEIYNHAVYEEYANKRIDEMFKRAGYNTQIVDIETVQHFSAGYNSNFYILDNEGTLYKLTVDRDFSFEKLEENIVQIALSGSFYYALDENGKIWSNKTAFSSADWILTTNIKYNGEKIYSDVAPYIKDGRTLAPIRAILEALGMTVTWNADTRTATATKGETIISIAIDSNSAIVNGEVKLLDVPAEITGGRTFVPVRFFAEVLNMAVDWDSYTKTVIINSK